MAQRSIACLLLLLLLIEDARTVVLRHGGGSGGGGGTRAPQLKWDPDKDLILLGEDVVSDNIAGEQARGAGDTVANHTVQQGTTAFLPCHVRHLADKKVGRKVTWIRRRDYHILTSGIQTQTLDDRFSVVRGESSDDWSLQIKFVQARDHGLYECQVPTKTGRYVYRVFLTVVVPIASIIGSKELHVQSGSTISLLCVIDGTIKPSPFVFWFHNQNMINYDRQRGGINVATEHQPRTSTRLTIADATYADSGNYTCSASNTNSSVNVFVSEGDKTAAIQRLGSGSNSILAPMLPLFLPALFYGHTLLLFQLRVVAPNSIMLGGT